MTTKVCGSCKTEKTLDMFNPNRSKKNYSYGVYPVCKECSSTKSRLSYIKHKEKRKEGIRSYHLRSKYGLSLEQFFDLVKKQNGLCACCGEKQDYKTVGKTHQELYVDHCHETGRVRGLLCGRCNTGIGMLGDTLEHLRKAVTYLEARIQDD